ncbi:MAG: hypothetical protein H6868_05885 [Rhodospirillales bacterium]|nr:hypothetical protein [Rhodospirillales bacterium]
MNGRTNQADHHSMMFRYLLCFSFLMITIVSTATHQAYAAADTACDPQYMDALEARGRMEAQREIAQNQNLIAKPDSVLTYSCFGSLVGHLAGEDLFSENSHIGTPEVRLPGQTRDLLVLMVGDALSLYLQWNFSHNFIGDRLNFGGGIGGVGGGGYHCQNMFKVWQAARCIDFYNLPYSDRSDKDGFFDFPWYGSDDPRDLPHAMASCLPSINPIHLTIAFNGKEALYTLAAENPNDAAPYLEDPVKTYLAWIMYKGHPMAPVCHNPPIKTGVTVKRNNFAPPAYGDAVCPNPGCWFNAAANSCQ